MNKFTNIAPCGLKLGGGLISDGEKIRYFPYGNNLETNEPDYSRCIEQKENGVMPILYLDGEYPLYYLGDVINDIMGFVGLDNETLDRLAFYSLDSENNITKIGAIGGGSASQSIAYIKIDDLTTDNPSVTVEGIMSMIMECYNKDVLPCIVADYNRLFYPTQWLGDTSPISTQSARMYIFYAINNSGFDKITITDNTCTLTQIKFQIASE